MAETKVTGKEIAFSKTVDANGWTVYDYGTFKQYRKLGSFTQSVGASSWVSGVGSTGLPYGMSTLGTSFVEAAIGTSDAAASPILKDFGSASTTFTFRIGNQYSSSINPIICWSICITTA